jgi:hypothetical protein
MVTQSNDFIEVIIIIEVGDMGLTWPQKRHMGIAPETRSTPATPTPYNIRRGTEDRVWGVTVGASLDSSGVQLYLFSDTKPKSLRLGANCQRNPN